MIAEGKLQIDLLADGGVQIRSNRNTSVTSLLIGRTPDEALELLPAVYSLCAHAHVAAARAALGEASCVGEDQMVLAENAREHLLRIMVGWTNGAIEIPAAPVMSLVGQMQEGLAGNDVALVSDQLAKLLKAHVFGLDPQTFLQLEFDQWLATENTSVARFFQKIIASDWQAIGGISPSFLPEFSMEQLSRQMVDETYCLAPDWFGTPCETGPLARQNNHPMIAKLICKYGNGLLARLAARLVDLAQIPLQMLAANPGIQQEGMGVVETARGRLIHVAKVRDGAIKSYQIIAPTEWNFHPSGVAAQALRGLNAPQARVMIEAFDPCVDFELRVA